MIYYYAIATFADGTDHFCLHTGCSKRDVQHTPPSPGAPRRAPFPDEAAATEAPEAYPLGRTVRRIKSTTVVRAARCESAGSWLRTLRGESKVWKGRVLARLGVRAGVNEDFFTILSGSRH